MNLSANDGIFTRGVIVGPAESMNADFPFRDLSAASSNLLVGNVGEDGPQLVCPVENPAGKCRSEGASFLLGSDGHVSVSPSGGASKIISQVALNKKLTAYLRSRPC